MWIQMVIIQYCRLVFYCQVRILVVLSFILVAYQLVLLSFVQQLQQAANILFRQHSVEKLNTNQCTKRKFVQNSHSTLIRFFTSPCNVHIQVWYPSSIVKPSAVLFGCYFLSCVQQHLQTTIVASPLQYIYILHGVLLAQNTKCSLAV